MAAPCGYRWLPEICTLGSCYERCTARCSLPARSESSMVTPDQGDMHIHVAVCIIPHRKLALDCACECHALDQVMSLVTPPTSSYLRFIATLSSAVPATFDNTDTISPMAIDITQGTQYGEERRQRAQGTEHVLAAYIPHGIIQVHSRYDYNATSLLACSLARFSWQWRWHCDCMRECMSLNDSFSYCTVLQRE